MREIKRSALVAQSPSRMYALINDIESYPQFVPWCTSARIESRSEREIVATLGVRRGPLRAEFTTRNELDPNRSVHMQLVRGPFRFLEGQWAISAIGDAGCRIELSMRFAFLNAVTAMVFEPLFEQTAVSLVDAFVSRARSLLMDPPLKTCTIAYATPVRQYLWTIQVPAHASVAEVLAAARAMAATENIPWDSAPVGIFGEACTREHIPLDGDRVELYRPLRQDPRERRRREVREGREPRGP